MKSWEKETVEGGAGAPAAHNATSHQAATSTSAIFRRQLSRPHGCVTDAGFGIISKNTHTAHRAAALLVL